MWVSPTRSRHNMASSRNAAGARLCSQARASGARGKAPCSTLDKAERRGTRLCFWNTKPTWARSRRSACASRPPSGVPNSRTSPASGRIRCIQQRSSVDLPAPLAPMSATRWPVATWKCTLLSTGVPGSKDLPNALTTRSATGLPVADVPGPMTGDEPTNDVTGVGACSIRAAGSGQRDMAPFSITDEGGVLRLADGGVHLAHVVVVGVGDAGDELHALELLVFVRAEQHGCNQRFGVFAEDLLHLGDHGVGHVGAGEQHVVGQVTTARDDLEDHIRVALGQAGQIGAVDADGGDGTALHGLDRHVAV